MNKPRRTWLGLLALIAASAFAAEGSSIAGEAPRTVPQRVVAPQTEGPFYKSGSPERRDLSETGIPGRALTISGYVFGKDGTPLANAWLDFWQADGEGRYDDQGYRLRGHQYTDAYGGYMLETVWPGEYPGRTNHIHVKIRARPGAATVTTQLYFPGARGNASDGIFDPAMVVALGKDRSGAARAYFNFQLDD